MKIGDFVYHGIYEEVWEIVSEKGLWLFAYTAPELYHVLTEDEKEKHILWAKANNVEIEKK